MDAERSFTSNGSDKKGMRINCANKRGEIGSTRDSASGRNGNGELRAGGPTLSTSTCKQTNRRPTFMSVILDYQPDLPSLPRTKMHYLRGFNNVMPKRARLDLRRRRHKRYKKQSKRRKSRRQCKGRTTSLIYNTTNNNKNNDSFSIALDKALCGLARPH